MSYTVRTQVLLTSEQRSKVERLAERSSRSVGAVIRDAIDAYVREPSDADRQRALLALFSLDAPVDDWAALDQEIEEGYRS